MAKKKAEIVEEIKQEEVIETEIIEEVVNIESIEGMYSANISKQKDISNISSRIIYINNEIKKEQYTTSNLKKIQLSRELTEEETKKLSDAELTIIEFERQLKVNDEKIKKLKEEVELNLVTIENFLIKYSKDILKAKAELKNEKQVLVKNIIECVKNSIEKENEIISKSKELTEKIKKSMSFGVKNITNYTNFDVEQARIENDIEDLNLNDIHIKDILNRFKDIEKYCKRKGI